MLPLKEGFFLSQVPYYILVSLCKQTSWLLQYKIRTSTYAIEKHDQSRGIDFICFTGNVQIVIPQLLQKQTTLIMETLYQRTRTRALRLTDTLKELDLYGGYSKNGKKFDVHILRTSIP